MSRYSYTCSVGQWRSAIDQAVEWQKLAFPGANDRIYTMGMAATKWGRVYVTASLRDLWDVLLIPVDAQEGKSGPPENSMVVFTDTHKVLQLRTELDSVKPECNLTLKHDPHSREVQFAWGNQKRVLRSRVGPARQMPEPPLFVPWTQWQPILSLRLPRKNWLETLKSIQDIDRRCLFHLKGPVPCLWSGDTGEAISAEAFECCLAFNLNVKTLKAYLTIVDTDAVWMKLYRTHAGDTHVIQILSPKAELYAYCTEIDPEF